MAGARASARASAPAPRTVIVGAGIVGLSSAYFLARRGVPVVVIDREPVGSGASGGNAGLLSIGHAPLTKPGASVRGLKWMASRTSPLYIVPRPDAALLSWLWTFHRHCTQAWLDRCMVVLADMGWKSLPLFERLIADEGIDCDYRRDGWLDVVLDAGNMAAAEAEARALAPLGFHHERLDGDELRRRAPGFRDEVAGAIHHLDSAHCHPGDFMRGLWRACQRHGVTLRQDAAVRVRVGPGGRVSGVELAGGEIVAAERVVLAAGVWSGGLGESVGVRVPMQAARGYHVQLAGVAQPPWTGCVLHETFVAVTPMRDELRLAGTLEIGPVDRPWMRERLATLAAGARRYLRGVDEARVTAEWAGYRPCTADGMPAVGAAPGAEGLVMATGHAMMGMTLGPVTGQAVAALICGEPPPFDLEMLRVDRFD